MFIFSPRTKCSIVMTKVYFPKEHFNDSQKVEVSKKFIPLYCWICILIHFHSEEEEEEA